MAVLLEAFAIVYPNGQLYQDTGGSNGIYTTAGRAQAVVNKHNKFAAAQIERFKERGIPLYPWMEQEYEVKVVPMKIVTED
jgi:hypothetical protein